MKNESTAANCWYPHTILYDLINASESWQSVSANV